MKVKIKGVFTGVIVVFAVALAALSLVSCGSSSTEGSSTGPGEKLPPGVSKTQSTSTVSGTSTTSSTSPRSTTPAGTSTTSGSSSSSSDASSPETSATLYGARVTAVSVTRADSNKTVVSTGGREVKGDYLEIKLTIDNVAVDHLVDLSEYSFRLRSPGIPAAGYANYYGDAGTYGKYVDTDEVSATLLSYSNLEAVTFKVKVGEKVTDIFLFFDLNPENVGKNPNVTADNTNLVIYKASGTEYGTEQLIPLSGYSGFKG